MPGENIQDWSVTATDNANSDTSINWQEGQPRASVNNSARSMMAAHAKDRNLHNGSIVTSGTINAQAFTSGVTYTAIPTGLVVLLKVGAGLTNTGPTTITMDGIAPVAIKTQGGLDLGGGELIAGAYVSFLYDGTNWILLRGGSRVLSQVFTASGVYTPTPGMTHCIIECVGGGAGGGAAAAANSPLDFYMGGGGGGAGGYSRKYSTAAEVGTSLAVTIGAGGAGGGFGAVSNNGAGGLLTSVGAICTASGGGGGGGAVYGGLDNPFGGANAASGVGTFTAVGSAGSPGMALIIPGANGQNIATGGMGAASFFGGGGQGAIAYSSGANGGAGGKYGAGGGGGASAYAGYQGNGGAGSPGVVIITEFVTS